MLFIDDTDKRISIASNTAVVLVPMIQAVKKTNTMLGISCIVTVAFCLRVDQYVKDTPY